MSIVIVIVEFFIAASTKYHVKLSYNSPQRTKCSPRRTVQVSWLLQFVIFAFLHTFKPPPNDSQKATEGTTVPNVT